MPREFFKELINDLRQMNYTEFNSDAFNEYVKIIENKTNGYGN